MTSEPRGKVVEWKEFFTGEQTCGGSFLGNPQKLSPSKI